MNLIKEQESFSSSDQHCIKLGGVRDALGQDLSEIDSQFITPNGNQIALAQPRRTTKEQVIRTFLLRKARLARNLKRLRDVLLADDVAKARWLHVSEVGRLVIHIVPPVHSTWTSSIDAEPDHEQSALDRLQPLIGR